MTYLKNIYIIIGKSLSGKTTLLNKVINNRSNAVTQLVTTTTRPKRSEETGKEYHFIKQEEYNPKKAIAPRVYKVANQKENYWTYFLSTDELKAFEENPQYQNAIMIIDYQGYLDLEKYIDRHTELSIQGIYLNVDLITRLNRYLSTERKNDDAKETLRRLYKDEFVDFKGLDIQTEDERLVNHKIHTFTNSNDAINFLLKAIR